VRQCLFCLVACLLLFGCQAPDGAASGGGAGDANHAGEITPGNPDYAKWRAKAKRPSGARTDGDVVAEGDIFELPKFVVREKGFVDYGFSIITNEEVFRGKPVKWVQIGVVLPDSIAEQCKLTSGMKIVAIDDLPVTDLFKEDLVQLLFERERTDRVRLLVLSRQLGLLPMFIDLTAYPATEN
jgi:hypothetical protein